MTQFKNYYQRKGGGTTFTLYNAGSSQNGTNFNPIFSQGPEDPINPEWGGLVGSDDIDSDAPKISENINNRGQLYARNVDYVKWMNLDLLYVPGVPHHDADLKGVGVQHGMITWYVRRDVLDDLQ